MVRGAAKLSLKFDKWPITDRQLFDNAFRKSGNPFDDQALGGHLAPSSIRVIRHSYGRWLGWIAIHDAGAIEKQAHERANSKTVKRYCSHLALSCNGVSQCSYVARLYDALRYMYPDADWGWLRSIVSRLESIAVPASRPALPLHASQLWSFGEDMFDEAQSKIADGQLSRTGETRRICELGRDGLLLMFLAIYPLRRTSLARLVFGSTVQKTETSWQVSLPAEYLKGNRSEYVVLPSPIARKLGAYVANIHGRFPAVEEHLALWPSWRGRALTGASLHQIFKRRLKEHTGHDLTLHDARRIAATSFAVFDPENVSVASDLLGHTDFKVTQKHYVRAGSVQASRVLSRVVDELRLSKLR
ncbi:tyrosine-type recombinase/integrase [Anderseniella sp. Alg231-50]|uniref:tyrosine-type recombinase/integrase n=1 Tax=Anderseniella sp. Alg231-50 TaxID=1922226 RepID=UPI000D55EADC